MKKLTMLALMVTIGLLGACSVSTTQFKERINIANTSWTMIQWNGSQNDEMNALIQTLPAKVTLSFSTERPNDTAGRVRAFAGCNNAVGQYAQQNIRSVSFGSLASTRKMCEPKLMEMENALLQKLSGANFDKSTSTTDAGDTLTLKSKDGQELIFLKKDMTSILE